jgi:uncharacterized membrane protein HdeD (DUF308 family)
MVAQARRNAADPSDVVAAVGRSWGWVLFFGIVSTVVGILVTAHPGNSLVAFSIFLGAWLFVGGIFRIVEAIADSDDSGGFRIAIALWGVLAILIGLFMMRNIGDSLAAIAFLIGIFWVIGGLVEFIVAIAHKGLPNRGWRIFMGILGFIAGIVVLEQPQISLVTLAWVMGIWLIVYGIFEIFLAFRIKGAASALTAA